MSVATTAEKIAEILLWPGTKICQFFGIQPTDDAGLIRSMFNMLVYLCILLPIVWIIL
ncbi:hypothetical protein SAMN05444273_103344 [Litoreibacter ascidiaceicola]|uniref:Uncharacterized protein n=1 Tax=Litoreibacter ascidiaceicola TaxID=1486859 RepID=A0A1M4XXZ8_9RHOB|nr:hypothetical protein [Litoreibacter ascidiaceicola]SHE98310.1 hypothetical protein SAMN05444273_103344 [Litoreibacter ascidiaceicola]